MNYRLMIDITAQPAEVFGELNMSVPTVKRVRASVEAGTKEECQAGYEEAWRIVGKRRCWIRALQDPTSEKEHETGRERWSAMLRLHFVDEDGPQENISPSSAEQVVYMGNSGKLK